MATTVLSANDLTRAHIGAHITAQPTTDSEVITVTGIIRWITLTPYHVIVAIEEPAYNAAWELDPDARITIEQAEG